MRLRSADKKPLVTPPHTVKQSVKKVRFTIEPELDQDNDHAKPQGKSALFLEKGRISFFYRPKVMLEKASSVNDLARFLVLLEPLQTAESDALPSRLIVIAKKHMPDLEKHEKAYAFVWRVGESSQLIEYMDSEEYDSVTRGHRFVKQARPCGHGVYGIVMKENQSYLAYVLEFPEAPAQVQVSLNIKKEGSYLVIIKNPVDASDPETAGRVWKGLSASARAHYDKELQRNFRDRRFVPAIPVSYLNHEGCEMLLIGMTEKLSEKLETVGEELEEWELNEEVKHSSLNDETVFQELHLDKTKFKSEALLGHWA